ncbi:MAG: ribonuclease PH [Anaerolineae bacterium]|nr:ribonuclease PH [Anaerolineae bacterium]
MRFDGRKPDQLRPLTLELSPVRYPEGAALVKLGDTHVLCAVTLQEGVPPWRRGSGKGWLTAEYALLPRATHSRTPRKHIEGGRVKEIHRLIGRSLRQAVDLSLLGERMLWVDCDVIQADGGTRTAAIIGGYVAVALAMHTLITDGNVPSGVLKPPVAAISAGVVNDEFLLDLAYAEDAQAQIDLNVVMDAQDHFIEIQGTAERGSVPRSTINTLLDLAATGIYDIIHIQREVLACNGIEV